MSQKYKLHDFRFSSFLCIYVPINTMQIYGAHTGFYIYTSINTKNIEFNSLRVLKKMLKCDCWSGVCLECCSWNIWMSYHLQTIIIFSMFRNLASFLLIEKDNTFYHFWMSRLYYKTYYYCEKNMFVFTSHVFVWFICTKVHSGIEYILAYCFTRQ